MAGIMAYAQLALSILWNYVAPLVGVGAVLVYAVVANAAKIPVDSLRRSVARRLVGTGTSALGRNVLAVLDDDGLWRLRRAEYDSENGGYWVDDGEGRLFFPSGGRGGEPGTWYGGTNLMVAYDGLGAVADLRSAELGRQAKVKRLATPTAEWRRGGLRGAFDDLVPDDLRDRVAVAAADGGRLAASVSRRAATRARREARAAADRIGDGLDREHDDVEDDAVADVDDSDDEFVVGEAFDDDVEDDVDEGAGPRTDGGVPGTDYDYTERADTRTDVGPDDVLDEPIPEVPGVEDGDVVDDEDVDVEVDPENGTVADVETRDHVSVDDDVEQAVEDPDGPDVAAVDLDVYDAVVPDRAVVDLRDCRYLAPYDVDPSAFDRVEENAKKGARGIGDLGALGTGALLLSAAMLGGILVYLGMSSGGGGGGVSLPIGGVLAPNLSLARDLAAGVVAP